MWKITEILSTGLIMSFDHEKFLYLMFSCTWLLLSKRLSHYSALHFQSLFCILYWTCVPLYMVIIIRKFILLIFSSIFILHSLLNMCWRQLSKCSCEQNDINFSSSRLNCAIHSKNFLIANISLIFTHTPILYHTNVFIKNLIIQVHFSVS